ncbi:Tex family protein [Reichenbachiella versicolor]|uniref:Tex family protein n=1 Tax=Reichenbachiella versicolor TaxID=1821036 RepID=UPI000D6E9BD7|nr:Tex family protein [Reichenbachiella versicolor]
MSQKHISIIAQEYSLPVSSVAAVIELLDEGATVPFISRYRKERTGSMDEVQVGNVKERISKLREIDKRREAILKSIDEQGKLTDELKKKIEAADSMAVLEDIYLPYKPKRKTKASIAKEKGLEPLAETLFNQGTVDPEEIALKYINDEKGVEDLEQALQGARDIIAEWVSENSEVRSSLRKMFISKSTITSKVFKGKEQEGQKYKDYFEWSEQLKNIPSHRLLAMRRGEKEMILSLDIHPDENEAIYAIENKVVKGSTACSGQVKIALKDAYKRLLKPSMETETRVQSKIFADEEAINVFSDNLRQLLLAPALGQKNVMAVDPGFRTGCKVVCLNRQGKLLEFEAIYPNQPQNRQREAAMTVAHMVQKHNIEAIAIGNGTASRETEDFVKSIGLPSNVIIAMVNEAGASIYSASEVAREEFPNEDVTVRGAVSIGRRMMDPLAELVKIDPKSIGVGQYQHDVDQNMLKGSLDTIVESCVNGVGVELNTASKQLLTYVSGLGPQLAGNIVKYRDENGPFKTRKSLMDVPRMGAKAFEQAAGFLRIRNSKNVLDGSAVHPERYTTVEQMAKDLNCTVQDLVKDSALRGKIDLKSYVTEEVGLPTLKDIIDELAKPGRDPRDKFEVFQFQEGVNEIKDLKIGMKIPGIVSNITKFGAFVDVGVHQDGLVHVSQLSDSFVSDPSKVVKLQQQVQVTVTEVDVASKRISLSLKSDPFGKPKKKFEKKRNEQQTPDGDLQSKLAMLKGKFNS